MDDRDWSIEVSVPVRQRSTQRLWVVLAWCAAAVGLFSVAFTSVSAQHPKATLGVVSGTIGAIIAALMTTATGRRELKPAQFVKYTTTARVVTVSWLLAAVLVIGGGVFGGLLRGESFAFGAGWIVGAFEAELGTLVGLASVILILGPGYSEYSDARAATE
ncbi:hypothetical protein GCM10009750_34950 [Agromyces salentinus]|uniref:Uncharacterized protein n=1 Tax=Agromyces salentinus TaxID=269421 RepID=A0ABN2N029_9MICO